MMGAGGPQVSRWRCYSVPVRGVEFYALYEMLGFERVTKLIDRGIIEVAPLAFMRGRTLNDSLPSSMPAM